MDNVIRNHGIDLLRILSMLMICMLHTLGAGGVLKGVSPDSSYYKIAWFFETVSFCGVDCYGLISGYVHENGHARLSRLLYLWLQVVVLNLAILLLNHFLPFEIKQYLGMKSGRATKLDIYRAIAPFSFRSLWYFTSFCASYWFQMLYNNIPPSNNTIFISLALIVTYSIIPAFRGDILYTRWGYTSLWLTILFILGKTIRSISRHYRIHKSYCLIAFWSCCCITWLGKIHAIPAFPIAKLDYTSPAILCAAISLVLFFATCQPTNTMKRVISYLTPLTFGVYVIHQNSFIMNSYINNAFTYITRYSKIRYTFSILQIPTTIFLMSSFFDSIREFLFRRFKVKERITPVDKLPLLFSWIRT